MGGFFPAWTHSVGAMKEARDAKPEHFNVTVTCDTCDQGRDVDLDAIIAANGPTFSLINRRARCRLTPGCTGYNRFHYQSGVMRRLWTNDQCDRWSRINWDRKQQQEKVRQIIVGILRGRDVRFDRCPPGIEPILWAVANDSEREFLKSRAGINPVDQPRHGR